MRYHYQTGQIIPFTKKFYKQLILAVAAIFMSTMALLTLSVSAIDVQGCDFDQSVVGTWSLTGDCVSTAQINLPASTTLEGNGHTISPNWTKTNNSNNSVVGIIDVDNVTVQNLTIDGTAGTDLHGIQAYTADGINVNDVTIVDNDRTGLLVNGSTVTVDNITTGGNGWHGVNVDLGSGVVGPAVLTVNGTSHHTDTLHIYVDDSTKAVSVVDTNSQYDVSHPNLGGIHPNDSLYTLHVPVVLGSKDECKKGGWIDSEAPVFKNQGQCVSYFATQQ